MQKRNDKKDNFLLPALGKKRNLLTEKLFSLRWFITIISMGFASSAFFAIALYATTHGRIQLSKLAQAGSKLIFNSKEGIQRDRFAPIVPLQRFGFKKAIDMGVSQKDFSGSVIVPQKFEIVHLSLSETNTGRFKYPKFNPLNLFSNSKDSNFSANIEQLYDGKVDSEIIFKKLKFEPNNVTFATKNNIKLNEIELDIRKNFNRFNNGEISINNLPFNYLNNNNLNKKIVGLNAKAPQNISFISKEERNNIIYNYTEDLIPFDSHKSIAKILSIANYNDIYSQKIADTLTNILTKEQLAQGSIIRLGLETDNKGNTIIIRASLYKNTEHLATVAMNDENDFEQAPPPEITSVLNKALAGNIPNIKLMEGQSIPLYDSIYRAALNYNMSTDLIDQMMRILASDINLQDLTKNNDTINIFYPVAKQGQEQEDIIYIQASINDKIHKYYRYKAINGAIDYYNTEGKSAKQFLLRKPVPNAHFSSPFGARRHPILGNVRMHTGVDWAAPLHSIIVASGDGIVTKVGPMSGYGNHTEIQHANGYMTSYSHQSGFAAGIRPGVHVHQGQVIGYIGMTGLSTGAHCHFEILVNGKRVNPMRVHIPNGKILKDKDLTLFEQKRSSIDATLAAHNF